MPESQTDRKSFSFEPLRALFLTTAVFTDQSIRNLYMVNFLFYLTIIGFFRVILMYMVDEWKMSVGQVTVYYAFMTVCSIAASFVITPRLSNHISMRKLASVTAIAGGLMMMVIVIPRSPLSLLFTAGSDSLLLTLTLSACAALLSSSVSNERQGSVMGNNQALQVGGEALGAFVGGLMAAVLVKLPLVVFGAVLLLAGLLVSSFRLPKQVLSS